jgi:hypothetical protein
MMTDQKRGCLVQMVTAAEWPSFFYRLAGFHRGRPVRVTAEGIVNMPSALLLDVALTYSDAGAAVDVITGAADASYTTAIQGIDLVWAIHDGVGKLIAVDITGKDGRYATLCFDHNGRDGRHSPL